MLFQSVRLNVQTIKSKIEQMAELIMVANCVACASRNGDKIFLRRISIAKNTVEK